LHVNHQGDVDNMVTSTITTYSSKQLITWHSQWPRIHSCDTKTSLLKEKYRCVSNYAKSLKSWTKVVTGSVIIKIHTFSIHH